MPFLRAHAFKPRIRQNHIHLSPSIQERNPERAPYRVDASRRGPEGGGNIQPTVKNEARGIFANYPYYLRIFYTTRRFTRCGQHACSCPGRCTYAIRFHALGPSAHPATRQAACVFHALGPATYPAATAAHGRVRAFRPKRTPLPVRILPCASACPPSCAPYNKKPRLLAGVCKKYLSNYSILFFKRLAILSNSSSE